MQPGAASDPADALRGLGYALEGERWVHSGLGLSLRDPAELLRSPVEALERIHDLEGWPQVPPPPPPQMGPEMSEAIRRNGLRWEGWMGAWSAPSGELLPASEVERLGSASLAGMADAREAWEAEQALRSRAGCAGMGLMFLWAGVGWLAGLWPWLGGMVLIAAVSWRYRPLRRLPAPYDALEGVDLEGLMARAEEALPEGWKDLAEITPVLAASPGLVYLPALDRTLSVEALQGFYRPTFHALLSQIERDVPPIP